MRRRDVRRVFLQLLLVLLAMSGAGSAVRAQAPWDVQLSVDPYPSPYLSDWETNPTISTLTVTNPTGHDRPVSLVYRVTDRAGSVLASGRSDPQDLAPGVTTYTSFVDLSGSSSHDASLEHQMRRTGRLPEGDYSVCVVATDQGGFVLAEACVQFAIVYPDPPLLIAPLDDDALSTTQPVFQWTPLQVPIEYRVQYVLRVAEIMDRQTPDEALRSNIPLYENYDVGAPNLSYPIAARPLEQGKRYAWRVQALDQYGYPPSSNNGMSEVRTFVYDPEPPPGPTGPLSPFTMRLAFFDPAGELPELWRTLDTSSVTGLLKYVQKRAAEGDLEIPLPLPSLASLGTAGPGPLRSGGAQGGSWRAAAQGPACAAESLMTTPSPAALRNVLQQAWNGERDAGGDAPGGWKAEWEGEIDALKPMLECLGVPDWNLPPLGASVAVQLAVWQTRGSGMPHITIAIKPKIHLFSDDGLILKHSVFVVNVVGDFTISEKDLPDVMKAFWGPYKFEVWGTGVIDLLTGLAGARKDKSKLWQAMPGLNFFAVVDLKAWRERLGQEGFGLGMDSLILQAFVGFREKTYRGIQTGGSQLHSDKRSRDRWYVRGSVPIRSFAILPGATSRQLQIEIGRTDSIAASQIKLIGDNSTALKRYRVVARLVVSGFDGLKRWVGVAPESTLAFFAEFKFEMTRFQDTAYGAPSTPEVPAVNRERSGAVGEPQISGPIDDKDSTRARSGAVADPTQQYQPAGAPGDTTFRGRFGNPQFSVTFGTKATFEIPGVRVFLHDVKLTWTPTTGTVSLSTAWGIGRMERIGTLAITADRKVVLDTTTSDPALNSIRKDIAFNQRIVDGYQKVLMEQYAEHDEATLRAMYIEIEARENEIAELEQDEQRVLALRPSHKKLRFRLAVRLDQGATAAEFISLGLDLAKWVAAQ